MASVLWFVVGVAVCVGLYWLAFRIEPHWVSKDGHRFLCNAQFLDEHGQPTGRLRETRVIVGADGMLQVDQKRLMKRHTEFFRVMGKSDDDGGKKAIYVLRSRGFDGIVHDMLLRLPRTSRAVTVLDRHLPA